MTAWRVAWIEDGRLIREDFHNHRTATARLTWLTAQRKTVYPEPYLISGYVWKDAA